jgi:hypothetical protein
MKQRIFISSVQKEFARERKALTAYLSSDPVLNKYFEAFLYEHLPASDLPPNALILDEVQNCDLYLGLFGNDYGPEDKNGLSCTHHEFNEATRLGKPRLIFVKGMFDEAKHPKMRALIREASSHLLRRRFQDTDDLLLEVYKSLANHIETSGHPTLSSSDLLHDKRKEGSVRLPKRSDVHSPRLRVSGPIDAGQNSTVRQRISAFISYSHLDKEFLTALHEHSAALRRQNLLEAWTDREIDAGGVLDDEIADAMNDANLFLLLVSSSFINSDYCYEKEFKKALEKYKLGKALIVPIIVRPCDWEIPELRQFKALPEDGKAVHSKHWHSMDEAFANIVSGLRSMLEKRRKKAERIQAAEHLPARESEKEVTRGAKFEKPVLPFAKEILDLILAHPNEEEQGLTEILRDSPEGPLHRAFIPNTTAAGAASSVKKSLFAPAVAELVRLGWLLQPEGNHAVRIYELNPDARRSAP